MLSPLLVPAAWALAVLILSRNERVWILGGLSLATLLAMILPGHFLPYYAASLTVPLSLLVPAIFEWGTGHGRRRRLTVLLPCAVLFAVALQGAIALPVENRASDGPDVLLADAISAVASPKDRLWVRTNHPALYYDTKLRPAARFFIAQGIRPSTAADAMAHFADAPPRCIVVHSVDDYAPLLPFLEEWYELLDMQGRFRAYRLRD